MAECKAEKCPMGGVANRRAGMDPYCFWVCGLRPPEPAKIVAITQGCGNWKTLLANTILTK